MYQDSITVYIVPYNTYSDTYTMIHSMTYKIMDKMMNRTPDTHQELR